MFAILAKSQRTEKGVHMSLLKWVHLHQPVARHMVPTLVILNRNKGGSYKSFAHMHQIKWRHITEDRTLNIHRNEKHKSHPSL